MPSLMETLNMGLDITGVVADFSSRARILGGCSTTNVRIHKAGGFVLQSTFVRRKCHVQ